MARGFDHLLATVALRLGVRLWAAVPNRGYRGHYRRDRPGEFNRLLTAAWRKTFVMEDVHGTSALYLNGKHANDVRNGFMVDTAQEFLAWNTGSTGTAHCVKAIKRAGKPCRDLRTIIG